MSVYTEELRDAAKARFKARCLETNSIFENHFVKNFNGLAKNSLIAWKAYSSGPNSILIKMDIRGFGFQHLDLTKNRLVN